MNNPTVVEVSEKEVRPQVVIEQISCGEPLFHDVLRLRAIAYGREEAGAQEDTDAHSLHFIAREHNRVLGALRVTCRCHGPLESERYYPSWILDEFGSRMCGSSRMCVAPEFQAVSSIPLDLTKFAWRTVLPLGVRIDISKARIKAIPYYLKMGYFFVRGSVFNFDRWNTQCGLIAYSANPNHQTRISEVFEAITDSCCLSSSTYEENFVRSYRDFVKEARKVNA